MIAVVTQVKPKVGVLAACNALGVPRSSYYRHQKPQAPIAVKSMRAPSPRTLRAAERQEVVNVVHEERFLDQSVPQIHAQLLEEGRYICSERTMYRILVAQQEVRERRAQARRPRVKIPRLVATAPRRVWSWDITKIPGPFKRLWFHLYVVLDLYSRFVVAWMLAHRESGALAKRLIEEACRREGIGRGQLTVHADRGPAMKSKTLKEFLGDMGIDKSHSRPRVSNDNCYSESQFKTLKYHPGAVDHVQSIFHGRNHFGDMFDWYNYEHHHSGLAMLTPATVHYGMVDQVVAQKQAALDAAYLRHPERFAAGPPVAPRPPTEVWINRPQDGTAALIADTPRGEGTGKRILSGSEPASTEVRQ